MIEEIVPNIFRITIPLPDHPLLNINSYLIKDTDRTLVIDTGWNRLECSQVLLEAMDELNVNHARTDVFLTHIHADHSGLLGLFRHRQSRIFCGAGDLARRQHYLNVGFDSSWPVLKELAQPHGFPAGEIEAALAAHTGNNYAPRSLEAVTPVTGETVLTTGRLQFHCLPTPGHTPGHFCLYEPQHKLLFSGDHLLGGFAPTIAQWVMEDTYVASYLASMENLLKLDIQLVLPGHWAPFSNARQRIEETLSHHHQRQQEILALAESPQTAYAIASQLTYNKNQNEWPFFSFSRKWGAVADALAQLCWLHQQDLVVMHRSSDQITWQRR